VRYSTTGGEAHCLTPAKESTALASELGSEEVLVGAVGFGGGYAVEGIEAGGKEAGEASDADVEADGFHDEGVKG
jgi:hypothetical protein